MLSSRFLSVHVGRKACLWSACVGRERVPEGAVRHGACCLLSRPWFLKQIQNLTTSTSCCIEGFISPLHPAEVTWQRGVERGGVRTEVFPCPCCLSGVQRLALKRAAADSDEIPTEGPSSLVKCPVFSPDEGASGRASFLGTADSEQPPVGAPRGCFPSQKGQG